MQYFIVSDYFNFYGRADWIRTNEMSESESDALPLGYGSIWLGMCDSNTR